jgi:hypothetical protein|tara:strand:+ start:5546 stop:6301 length:756 start_codon:yes stop_codon:yes gene_type:complete
MGGRGSGRKTNVENLLQKQNAIIASGDNSMFIPNLSGDHSAGTTATPAEDMALANKKYVDDNIGGGSGTLNTLKEDGAQVGGADITTLDFLGADFNLSESPDKEINISIADAGIDHDSTTNFVANEHLDWTSSVGTIHADNYTNTNTNQLTTFTLTADGGSNQTISQGNSLTISGGTNCTTAVGATDTVTVNVDDAFLKNDAADIGVGLQLTQDNGSADTQYTAQVLYNTDGTPPAASGFPIGTIYVQYTA